MRADIRNDIAANRFHMLPGVEIHDAVIVSATVADKTATIVVRLNVIGREYYANEFGDIIEGDDAVPQVGRGLDVPARSRRRRDV